MFRSAAVCLIFPAMVAAQLIPTGQPLPRRDKPPIVFLNGYQQTCPSGGMTGTFGQAATLFQATGRASVFFDNCTAGRVVIEQLGQNFGTFLNALRYEDGQPVNQVDIVAHSMGGLIVRSYLAGKQTAEGVFTPPAETKIRKIVFLATPQFGTSAAGLTSDVQTQQLAPGSRFIYDLATWNQGIDDFRGSEAISILGDAGSGFVGGPAQFTDGVVSLTSGSLLAFGAANTRIIRACHTSPAFICTTGAIPIAQMNETTHPAFPIVSSFLEGTDAWKTAGQSPDQNSFLTNSAGLIVRWKSAADQAQAIQTASAAPQGAATVTLSANQGIAYTERVASGNLQIQIGGGGQTATRVFESKAATTGVLTLKAGPYIGAAIPAAGLVTPRVVAPGTFISIYGADLATGTTVATTTPFPLKLGDTEVFANDRALPLQVVSPGQVNAVLLDGLSGLVKLRVRTTQGEHTANVLLEPAMPAVFIREGIAAALNAVSSAIITRDNPIRAGEFVSLYLTGLGATTTRDGLEWATIQPTVTIGGKPCALLYAGRSTFAGVDQINCQVAPDAETNSNSPVVITSGNRVSPTVPIPVRQ